ncbi:4-(cytidine 5'-diphospho)-2-C-methyl-D-erythritol kinase [Shinella yambaruensis]|uniref:4-diphosphocytidyl-2-C-methyl-D-erythritol kinase n=1 Tax=Shinella yambaruensis TaxID=415996 RepID=A0ABQ5ZPB1_9HYPH|nr:4-(cytidine 5'-diphospho)-2-C-methyl-D-erythritol kinase [Shinella yambaruensis]MCJ8026470.1 4-(cytidine 5'-diphospho)-2-C-methyl-D-erythritol kinase [Shinella yambaruensis]MCU7982264.1 4-(cytidine 5'-diphospho)-2-C-methyl-D-erythritol kinase [Shinella yambaruensis]GLR53940.1 4-diphosphocytidyl-2-C-methyl-D-erythritol kinase [Shinella yambaruensis]
MADADALSGFAVVEPAPAKINLALAVTSRREDGYHLLDSLVTFTAFGDRIGLAPAAEDRFTLTGRFCGVLSAEADNLVTRARDRLRAALAPTGQPVPPVHIHLEKNLPIASGIGGGSADAAATLRGLISLWKAELPADGLDALAIGLGADVPMCLASRPLRARGVGEAITPVALPALPIVLANPLVGVSTPAVFQALASRHNPPLALAGAAGWAEALARLRNDLEPPARRLCPEIAAISESLAATGAGLVRMSGSGATCFALYDTDAAAETAAAALSRRHPHWFFTATRTLEAQGKGADDGAY